MAVLHVKLTPSASPADKREFIASTRNVSGVSQVRVLFPQTKSAKLADIYTVETSDGGTAESLLSALRTNPSVEYAETAPERRAL